MGYKTLAACVADLEKQKRLLRINNELDPYLEIGAVQRRVYAAGGPALLFTRPTGCRFPLLGNLFGTLERTRFIFRDTLDDIQLLVRLKLDPRELLRHPAGLLKAPRAALHLLPRSVGSGPILQHRTSLDDLPKIVSWPRDGGPFVTLPQVYSESATRPGFRNANLGMYRVQLSGNEYLQDVEVGLHYQLHRGIGAHHAEALERGMPFRVIKTIFLTWISLKS